MFMEDARVGNLANVITVPARSAADADSATGLADSSIVLMEDLFEFSWSRSSSAMFEQI